MSVFWGLGLCALRLRGFRGGLGSGFGGKKSLRTCMKAFGALSVISWQVRMRTLLQSRTL